MSKNDLVSIDEVEHKATITYGLGTLLFRVLIGAAICGTPLLIAGAVSYSDGHNDERYVQRQRYESDRQMDALKERELDKKLGAIEALIREQSGDIKALIREPRK